MTDSTASRPVLASSLAFALFFCLALFLAVPYFTRTQRLRAVVEDQQRIASSPFATLAHLQTGASTPVAGSRCGIRLTGPPAGRELVLFVHPSCAQCARTIAEAAPLAATGAAEIYLALAPKDAKGPDREACAALVAVALEFGPDAFFHAYAVAKKDFEAFAGDPLRVLRDELSLDDSLPTAHIESGRDLVSEAERLADALVEGTPALFFESRLYPYAAPVAHLEFLLTHHPDLLPARSAGEKATQQ